MIELKNGQIDLLAHLNRIDELNIINDEQNNSINIKLNVPNF